MLNFKNFTLKAKEVLNINLKNKLDELQKRNEELYAQVNAMVQVLESYEFSI